VDLLLHLLSNVKDLPVTTSVVKASKLGPAIGKLGKHSICKGTPNESAILERVSGIKDAWKASVKARKEQVGFGNVASVELSLICRPHMIFIHTS